MHRDIKRVLIDEAAIQTRLDQLAEKIKTDFEGKQIVVVALLKGAVFFMADLMRRVPIKMEFEYLKVSSYHGAMQSSGKVEFSDQRSPEVEGKHVILLDDVLDTGLTIEAVSKKLHELGALSLKTCVLISKDISRECVKEADYTGFVIGDEFVVGYGLDYREKYRNLPYVGILKTSAI